jgi:hypothetical protein
MERAVAISIVFLACSGIFAAASSSGAAMREQVTVWEQQPDLLEGYAYTASLRLSDGYWAEAADDFELPYSASVDAIEWWGSHGPPEELEYVIVRFYLDDQTLGRSLPGATAYQETIHVFVGEEVTGNSGSDYRYTADLPVAFEVSAANRYWISIQGVEQSSQWYWYESPPDGYWGHAAAVRTDFWGFPDWTAYSDLAEGVHAFSFVLYADSTVTESMTWGSLKALFR